MAIHAPTPEHEDRRLASLRDYQILDSLPEQAYDDVVFLASQICESPIALMSLVDEHRQWFKAKVGIDAEETSREISFCGHAIMTPNELLVVEDALEDKRFFDNDLVANDPNIRFYAGSPLVTQDGDALGTLCVIDTIPRRLSPREAQALAALSRQIIAQLELRKKLIELERINLQIEDSRIALARSNTDLERFAYVAAHDLKQPFRVISGFSSILKDELSQMLSEEQTQYLDMIESSSNRGSSLTTDLLSFSKLNTRAKIEDVDLYEVFTEVIGELKPEYPHADLECSSLFRLQGDRSQIHQLAKNLVGNGLKYNQSARPSVAITTEQFADGGQGLRIADNGIGIPEQHRKRIFEMFTRAHEDGQFEGTGIGLAICDRVMDLHDGSIGIDSADNGGSIFTCRFPAARISTGGDGAANLDIAS